MHYPKLCYTTVLALTAAIVSANAKNITINDLQYPNSSGYGAPGKGQGGEDQETEPGTLSGQNWDLEAFTLNGSLLSIYSGYNLLAGENPYGLGDLFIDVNGDANWQPGVDNHISGITSNDKFLYDYVVHFNNRSGTSIGAGEYMVYKLDGTRSEKFQETVYKSGSNPWIYLPTRQDLTHVVGSGKMAVETDLNDVLKLEDGTVVTGGAHYIGGINLDFLSSKELNGSPLFHLTMECGNDSLVGRVPDAGSTVGLLGAAMAGISMFTRSFRRKQ